MMKLPFLSHSKSLDSNLSSSLTPWTWPACANIKTLSFRDSNDPFRTFNSAFLDTEPDSLFTFSSSSLSDSTFVSDNDQADPVESVIRGLRSDRLFFHPEQSSSLLSSSLVDGKDNTQHIESQQVENDNVGYQESEILSMESSNPFEDFRKSMEEMVEAHGLKDWQKLEELLSCYLKINGHHNHGIIVGAFIDLLVSLSFASSTSASTSTSTSTSSSSSSSSSSTSSSLSSSLSSPSTCLTTPCLSPILDHGDDDDDDNNSKHDKHVDDFVSSLMN